MKIRCYAYFRDIVGHNELEWTLPVETMGDLLNSMAECYGPKFRYWVYQNKREGVVSDLVMFLVNGRDIRDLNGIDTPLHEDDVVALFPPVAGG
ncbi:MAG: ubiquitin-like small modifier protein 1 [Anaerolineaceae bacterium]